MSHFLGAFTRSMRVPGATARPPSRRGRTPGVRPGLIVLSGLLAAPMLGLPAPAIGSTTSAPAAIEAAAEPAVPPWAGTYTVTEKSTIEVDGVISDRSLQWDKTMTLRLTGETMSGSTESVTRTVAEVVEASSTYSDTTTTDTLTGVVCVRNVTHSMDTVTGPRPASPEFPGLLVQTRIFQPGESFSGFDGQLVDTGGYRVTSSGVTLTGPQRTVLGGNSIACPEDDRTDPATAFVDVGLGGKDSLPPDMVEFEGTRVEVDEADLESTYRRTVTWDLQHGGVGTLEVAKSAVPAEDGVSFRFTGAVEGEIKDGEVLRLGAPAGTYVVTEEEVPDWALARIECDDPGSTGNVATRTATYTVAPNQTVRCTFHNRRGLDAVDDSYEFEFDDDLDQIVLNDLGQREVYDTFLRCLPTACPGPNPAPRAPPARTLHVTENDVDAGPLRIIAVTQPAQGTVRISRLDATQLVFRPTRSQVGPVSFRYTVRNLGGSTDTATVEIAVASCRRVHNEIWDANDDARYFELTQELCTDGETARAYVRTKQNDGGGGEFLIPGLTFDADATTIVGSAGEGQQVIEGAGTAVVEGDPAPLQVTSTPNFQMCLDPTDLGPVGAGLAGVLRALAIELGIRLWVLRNLVTRAISAGTTQCMPFAVGVISYRIEPDATLVANFGWTAPGGWVLEGVVPRSWDGALPSVNPLAQSWRCLVGTVCRRQAR